MATSESDDFESADEELNARGASSRKVAAHRVRNIVDSESDDDTEFIPTQSRAFTQNTTCSKTKEIIYEQKFSDLIVCNDSKTKLPSESSKLQADDSKSEFVQSQIKTPKHEEKVEIKSDPKLNVEETESKLSKGNKNAEINSSDIKKETGEDTKSKVQKQRQPKQAQSFGAKRLGTISNSSLTINKPSSVFKVAEDAKRKANSEDNSPSQFKDSTTLTNSSKKSFLKQNPEPGVEEMPEELKSNLKFKEIFKPDGWEHFEKDVKWPDMLTEESITPILDNSNNIWGGWGSWGVGSLLNSASASVSTLTSRVNQGLTLLEETIGAPDPVDLVKADMDQQENAIISEESPKLPQENEAQSSFGFSNFMSGVSSISKLVESTGSKVITGGLDTLETIGKKTMEVLQEGDPGLKKKRAFFMNESDKPILSQMLKEVKEKAEAEEKILEERKAAKKVCFESLFDDNKGLVHLEALKLLSKQSNMRIQFKMINLDKQEYNSVKETLDEIKELCDLGDDDEEAEESKKDLKERLKAACQDFGIDVSYDKLHDLFQDINSLVVGCTNSEEKSLSHQELFEQAISALAKFTAYSVEIFHKSAELLLIKERRNTVNEVDALVQLTRILSGQIIVISILFCDKLREMMNFEMPDIISNISSIFLEVGNANTYIQEAFRLLIPVIQEGAI